MVITTDHIKCFRPLFMPVCVYFSCIFNI